MAVAGHATPFPPPGPGGPTAADLLASQPDSAAPAAGNPAPCNRRSTAPNNSRRGKPLARRTYTRRMLTCTNPATLNSRNRIVLTCAAPGRPRQPQPSHRLDQDVRRRAQQQTELVGQELVATGPVGEQHQLLLLVAVLALAAHRVVVVGRLVRSSRRRADC